MMTKREQLHRWLLEHDKWVYAREVPYSMFRTVADANSALRDLHESGRADMQIVGLKQYKGKPGATPVRGRGNKKLSAWTVIHLQHEE